MFGMVCIAAADALVLYSPLVLCSCLSTNTKKLTFTCKPILYSMQSRRLPVLLYVKQKVVPSCYPIRNPSIVRKTCCNLFNKKLTVRESMLRLICTCCMECCYFMIICLSHSLTLHSFYTSILSISLCYYSKVFCSSVVHHWFSLLLNL